MCKSCYLFCKKSLEHCGEDLCLPETILRAVEAKISELQSRLKQYSNSAELPLVHTAIYLGQQISDQPVTFPMLYHHYLSITKANDVPAQSGGMSLQIIFRVVFVSSPASSPSKGGEPNAW